MTASYRPDDPAYLNEGELRDELGRVFDLCQGCRLCFNLCPTFPTLFDLVDAHDGEASALTAAEQDRVVDQCYQCKLCHPKCPYVPPHEWQLDFPRLMLRAQAVGHARSRPVRTRITDQVLARTDLVGRLAVAVAPVANAVVASPGTPPRRVLERTAGLAAGRRLPSYARTRFTTWLRRRVVAPVAPPAPPRAASPVAAPPIAVPGGPPPAAAPPVGQVSVFPTCFIEYMEPAIGMDLVQVFERNGVACSLPRGTACCGAPWLHQGNVREFTRAARRNVAGLVDEVRAGREIVVAQPTCAYVLRKDYPLYLAGTAGAEDAALVADHTLDPAEYLMALHRQGRLDTDFPGRAGGAVPDRVTYHVACHLQAQHIGLKSRDLLKVAGVTVTLVQRCAGIDGTWGYRAENDALARAVAAPMTREIRAAGNDVVCGDCHLANGAIAEETGTRPLHPMQLLARAYGIPGHGA